MNNSINNSKILAYSAAAGATLAILPNSFNNRYSVFKEQKAKLMNMISIISNKSSQTYIQEN